MNRKQTAPDSLHPPVIAGVPTGGESRGLFEPMNTKNHTPTKTEYKSVTFRSRSEAMFAALLEKCRINDWIYEPDFISSDGWVPDFVIPLTLKNKYFEWVVIEYKPSRPTDTYFHEFRSRREDISLKTNFSIDASIVWVDWWNPGKWGFDVGVWSAKKEEPVAHFEGNFLFSNIRKEDLSEITKIRFDLLSTSGRRH